MDILSRLNACSSVMPSRARFSIIAGCSWKATDKWIVRSAEKTLGDAGEKEEEGEKARGVTGQTASEYHKEETEEREDVDNQKQKDAKQLEESEKAEVHKDDTILESEKEIEKPVEEEEGKDINTAANEPIHAQKIAEDENAVKIVDVEEKIELKEEKDTDNESCTESSDSDAVISSDDEDEEEDSKSNSCCCLIIVYNSFSDGGVLF